MNKPSNPKAETVETVETEAPKAPEAKAPSMTETETAEAKVRAEFLTDAAKLTAAIVSTFVDGADTEAIAYGKAEMLISAKALHISAVGLISDIQAKIDAGRPALDAEGNPVMLTDTEGNPVLDTEGNPVPKMIPLVGKAPSAGLLSQYRGGWEMMVKAGINPKGNAHLVALGVKAKAGTLNLYKADIDKIVEEVKVLPDESKLARMLALLEGSHPVQPKAPPVKAAPVTVSAFLTEALGAIPTLDAEALTEAAKAARKYAETAEAELAARVTKAEAEAEATKAEAERVTADTE